MKRGLVDRGGRTVVGGDVGGVAVGEGVGGMLSGVEVGDEAIRNMYEAMFDSTHRNLPSVHFDGIFALRFHSLQRIEAGLACKK